VKTSNPVHSPILVTLGLVIVLGASPLASAHLSWLDPPALSCGGTAPLTTSCETGHHASALGTIWHGPQLPLPAYTGTLVSVINWGPSPEMTRTFSCDIQAGTVLGCHGSGTFPPDVTLFTHSCTSNELRQTIPGGSGPWGCHVRHDALAGRLPVTGRLIECNFDEDFDGRPIGYGCSSQGADAYRSCNTGTPEDASCHLAVEVAGVAFPALLQAGQTAGLCETGASRCGAEAPGEAGWRLAWECDYYWFGARWTFWMEPGELQWWLKWLVT
jgi:hypothetical protein